jgi:hypothetical protein
MKFLWFLFFLSFAQLSWSQSDFVEKGHSGFEIDIGQAFVEGTNPFLAYVGGSIDGKLDLGVSLASLSSNSLYVFGGAFHFGGEKKDMGIALGAGYVVYPKVENYFVIGPSFYGRSMIGGVILIPNISFEIATTAEFNFISGVGLSIYTGGRAGFVMGPQFVFAPEQSYFSLSIGLLTHS